MKRAACQPHNHQKGFRKATSTASSGNFLAMVRDSDAEEVARVKQDFAGLWRFHTRPRLTTEADRCCNPATPEACAQRKSNRNQPKCPWADSQVANLPSYRIRRYCIPIPPHTSRNVWPDSRDGVHSSPTICEVGEVRRWHTDCCHGDPLNVNDGGDYEPEARRTASSAARTGGGNSGAD